MHAFPEKIWEDKTVSMVLNEKAVRVGKQSVGCTRGQEVMTRTSNWTTWEARHFACPALKKAL